MKKIPQEILIEIDRLLKKLCEKNINFADMIIKEINNPLNRSISFHKEKEGLLIVRFTASLSFDNDCFDYTKYDCKCELKISNSGFQYEKVSVTGKVDRRLGKYTRKDVLKCKKNSELTSFSKERYSESKRKESFDILSTLIHASNEIDIFNSSQQVSHEENKVELFCYPSHKGELYAKKILDNFGLVMKVTNPFALELLNRLEYSTQSVSINHSEHIQIWPILENSVVELIKKESVNSDRVWDAYYNEEMMFVGYNKYESHKKLKLRRICREEREIAEKYFEGSISIEEVLEKGKQLLLNYEEETKKYKNKID